MLKVCALSLSILILFLSTLANAQSSLSGAVGGSAWDAHRSAVPGAHISLQNSETGELFETRTGSYGAFRIVGLRPGLYSLKATGKGFADFHILRITVEVGRITEIEISFEVAGKPETVDVGDEVPAVNTTQADFATNISTDALDNLPINGRRWSNFALLTPTATLDGNFGLISFRGINGLMNNSTVDGADNNQAFFSEERGRTRISYVISPAAVREFQVNTSNFSAEYGRAAGAVVNSVTRSGGNHTHGQIFYYMRDNNLGATNAFTVVPVRDASGNWTTEKTKPLDRRQQFGASIGGPIVKNKLFYFFNFDGQRRDYPGIAAAAHPDSLFAKPCVTQAHYGRLSASDQPQVRVCSGRDELNTLKKVMPGIANTPAFDPAAIAAFQAGTDYLASLLGAIPRTADHQIFFSKIDYHLAPHHSLALSFNRMRWSSPGGVQSEPVVHRGVASFGFDGVKTDMLIARLTSAFSNHTTSELRYSWGRDFEYQSPQAPAPGEPVGPSGFAPSISVLGYSSGFTFGTPSFMPRRAFPDEHRNQLTQSISWIHGRHVLKFGYDVNHVNDEMNNLYAANGSYNYNYRDYFMADLYQWQHNTGTNFHGYSSYKQGFGTPAFSFNTLDLAGFIQDDWRPLRRLTLNFGLRYEYQTLPSPQTPNSALLATKSFPSDGNNLGPRFGFAWDVTGDGKTALRGGYGLYYGRISNSTISSAITETGTQAAQRSHSFCYAVTSYCSLVGPTFPNVYPTDPFASTMGGDVAVFARHMQNPQIHQVDLILEHQVSRKTVISASYLLSLGRQLPNFVDINLDPNSRTNVTYTFASDYYTGVPGPYNGHTLTVPVYTGRLNPNFETITEIRSNVNSSYNALVLQFNRSMTSGLGFKLNYTWSHAIDDNQNSTPFTAYNNTLSPIPFTYFFDNVSHYVAHPDYGTSNYDVRHRMTASMVWTPRLFRESNRILRAALDRWTVAPIVHIATGRPFSDKVNGEAPINTCEGCLGFMGTGGNTRLPFLGRNTFRYGALYNVDLRLSRQIYFGERSKLEFLAEAFNLLNHQIVTDRSDSYYSVYNHSLEYYSGFGKPTAAANTIYRERELQLGLRLHF
ncbi:MAG: hypothetical protein CXZ00_14445 [Acidobacteria bacterium]|nr:MAG: hypothetical protein CXZ00_14445 [Acidobacteriota bacterium]